MRLVAIAILRNSIITMKRNKKHKESPQASNLSGSQRTADCRDPYNYPLRPTVGSVAREMRRTNSELSELMGSSYDGDGGLESEYVYYNQLIDYDGDLEYEGNQISYEWATNEILGHQMNWVRLGLVAERVRRYRLYRFKYPDWHTYCTEALGKQTHLITKTIDAALVTMALIREGFDILPTCKSHALELIKICQKTKETAIDTWYEITAKLQHQVLITVPNIMEVTGFASEGKKSTLKLPKHLKERLQRVADNNDLSVEETIEQMLDVEENILPEEETEVTEEKEQLWHRDLKNLIEQHDSEIWLLTAIAKMTAPLRRKTSQFSWLKQVRQVRCQT